MAYEKYLHRIEYHDKCYYVISNHSEMSYVLELAKSRFNTVEQNSPMSIQRVSMSHLKWYNPYVYYKGNNSTGFFVTTHKPKNSEVHTLDFSILGETSFIQVNVRQDFIDTILEDISNGK